MSLALYHHQLLNVYFTRSFYKHILGIVPLTDCWYTLSTNFNVHVHAEIKLRDKVLANYKNLNFCCLVGFILVGTQCIKNGVFNFGELIMKSPDLSNFFLHNY